MDGIKEGEKVRKLVVWSMQSKTQINKSYRNKTKQKRVNGRGDEIIKEKIQENIQLIDMSWLLWKGSLSAHHHEF